MSAPKNLVAESEEDESRKRRRAGWPKGGSTGKRSPEHDDIISKKSYEKNTVKSPVAEYTASTERGVVVGKR